jgi:hypothetical protein
MVARAEPVPPPQRVAGLPPSQYLSADGRHVLVSERVGDSRVWDRFRLTIVERASGQRVGEFKSHLAHVPFFVNGAQVVYETGPYSRRVGNDVITEPLKLRATDLQTGQELWNRPIRDTAIRNPPPG